MFKNSTIKEEKVVASILNGGQALRQAMQFIYGQSGAKEMVFKYILAKNGTKEDAEDIFQDGICAFVLNVQRQKFDRKSHWKTYLVGICKNLWRKKFESIQKQSQLKTIAKNQAINLATPEDFYLQQEKANTLQKILGLLGTGCSKILQLWLASFSIKEIVQRTEYKNKNVVSKKKHQCLQKLYKIMETNENLRKSLIK